MGLVAEPFLLTLRLDPQSFRRLNEDRKTYFPAHLNRVPAHISLFHWLPAEEKTRIKDILTRHAGQENTFDVPIVNVRSLGRGVAYVLDSPQLLALHSRLSVAFRPWLTPQDRQGYRPHITIQNKVTSSEVRNCLSKIQATFHPFIAAGLGFCLWRYLGGPWELEKSYLFANQAMSVAGPMSP